MKKSEKYGYLKISSAELIRRILISDSPALRFNAFTEGCIVSTPVGKLDGKEVYHQFERHRGDFRDLGLSTV
jgi:hypothetical protein